MAALTLATPNQAGPPSKHLSLQGSYKIPQSFPVLKDVTLTATFIPFMSDCFLGQKGKTSSKSRWG